MGNGINVFIWFDNWLPMGLIYSVMGDSVIFEIGLSRNANVSTIIRNGQWRWSWTSSIDQLALKQVFEVLPPPRFLEHDQVI